MQQQQHIGRGSAPLRGERKGERADRHAAALDEIRRMRGQGAGIKVISRAVVMSGRTVRKLIAQHGIQMPERKPAPPRVDRPGRTANVGRFAKPAYAPVVAKPIQASTHVSKLPSLDEAAVADAAMARRHAEADRLIARKTSAAAVAAATRLPLREVFRLQSARRIAA